MIDESLRQEVRPESKAQYLLELLADNLIETSLYADNGPPAKAPRVTDAESGDTAPVGWVEIRPGERDHQRVVVRTKGGVPVETATHIGDSAYERVLLAEAPESYAVSGNPEELKLADAKAMLSASAIRADLFITERELPHALGHDPWSPVTVMTPEDALPVVGLYLRLQRQFLLARAPALGMPERPLSEIKRDRHHFYWEAAQLVLKESWRWDIACENHARDSGDDSLRMLKVAIFQRMAQSLQYRDHLLLAMSVRQNWDTADDALTALDGILLWLLGAFDSAARIVHHTLGIAGPMRQAGWQSSAWRTSLVAHDANLAALVDDNTDGGNLLRLLSRLRNNIHGQALSAGGVIPAVGAHTLETFVELPDDDRTEILRILENMGGTALWGAAAPHPGYDLHLHPGAFAERLIACSIRVLNSLMRATPVHLLVPGTPQENLAPGRIPLSLASQRLLWQLGLMEV